MKDNSNPEFDQPERFMGAPVVAAEYIPRQPARRPMWLVMAQRGPTCFDVALMIDHQESAQTWYDIESREKADQIMAGRLRIWRDGKPEEAASPS